MCRERREHRVFDKLLKTVPNLEERLMNSSEEEITMIGDLARTPVTPSSFSLTRSSVAERGFERQIR